MYFKNRSAVQTAQSLLLSLPVLAVMAMPAYAENNTVNLGSTYGLAVQPVISQYGVYNSNPMMLVNDSQELYGSVTSPELIISNTTPTTQLVFDNKLTENLMNLRGFSSTDVHSKNSFVTKTPTWTFGLDGNLDYDTSRSSEISTFGFQTLPVRHLGVDFTPQITYNATQIDRFALAGTMKVSTYKTSALTDYETYSVTPSYSRDLNPLNTASIQFKAEQYKATKGPRNITDTFGPSIGWNAKLTPRLTFNANVGGQISRQDRAGEVSQPWRSNYTFAGDVAYVDEEDNLHVKATRAQYPFGNGTDSLFTSFEAKDSHLLNTRLSLDIGASYQFADYPTQSTGNLDSLTTANGGVTYHVTKHVDILGTYQYRYENLTNVNKGIDDHSVNIGIVLHPQAWTF